MHQLRMEAHVVGIGIKYALQLLQPPTCCFVSYFEERRMTVWTTQIDATQKRVTNVGVFFVGHFGGKAMILNYFRND